jgi:hypothetical protein
MQLEAESEVGIGIGIGIWEMGEIGSIRGVRLPAYWRQSSCENPYHRPPCTIQMCSIPGVLYEIDWGNSIE